MSQSFADALSQVPMSRTLSSTFMRAHGYAKQQAHRRVMLEHLLLALCEDPDASPVLQACKVDIPRLSMDASSYMDRIEDRGPSPDAVDPVPDNDVMRILEYAAAAAHQSRRREISGAIVLAAIVGEGRSAAAHMLRSQGLTFEETIKALQRAANAVRQPPAPPHTVPSGAPPALPTPQAASSAAPQAPAPPRHEQTDRPTTQPPMNGISAPRSVDGAVPSAEDILASVRERINAGRPAQPATTTRPTSPPPANRTDPPRAPAQEHPQASGQPPIAGADWTPPQPPREPRVEPRSDIGAPPQAQPNRPSPPRTPVAWPSAMPPMPSQQDPTETGPGRHAADPPRMPQARPPQLPPRGFEPQPQHAPPQPYPPQWPGQQQGPGQQGPGQHEGLHPDRAPPRAEPEVGHRSWPGDAQRPPPQQAPAYHPSRQGSVGSGSAVARAPVPIPVPAPMNPSGQRGRASEPGQLVENIPRRMRVGVPEIVEIRIARAELENMGLGMEGRGAPVRHDLVVTRAMSVKLRAPDGGIWVETASPETQWIESRPGLMSDDFASWRWTVLPQRRGRTRLQLVAAARTVGVDGLAAETALPDQVIEVKIDANFAQSAARWGGWAAAAILGGVLAKFGERMWETSMQVVARFM